MLKTCQNCASFDASKHEKDPPTSHCGICLKFSEITFKNDIQCKHFISKNNPIELPKEIPKKVEIVQFELFPNY